MRSHAEKMHDRQLFRKSGLKSVTVNQEGSKLLNMTFRMKADTLSSLLFHYLVRSQPGGSS